MSLQYYIVTSADTITYRPNMVASLGHDNIFIRMSLDGSEGLMEFKNPHVPIAYSGMGYTDDEIILIMNSENWLSGSTEPTLRIYNYKVLPDNELLDFDFTLLGLHKYSYHEKGRKYRTDYFNEEETEVVVCKRFNDVNISGTTKLDYITVEIDWLKTDGSVGLQKNFEVTFSDVEKGDYMRKRRQRAIDYIVYFAKGTPLEVYMGMLFQHYKSEVDDFITTGSSSFEEALNNETDPTILNILNIVANPINGDTVREGILRNI